MAIQSVTSSLNAYAGGGVQSQQAQQTRQAEQAQQTRQAEQPSKAGERVERKEEMPRPVVNAQGQQTGTLINVVA